MFLLGDGLFALKQFSNALEVGCVRKFQVVVSSWCATMRNELMWGLAPSGPQPAPLTCSRYEGAVSVQRFIWRKIILTSHEIPEKEGALL